MGVSNHRKKRDEWCFSKPELRVQWPYEKWYRAHIEKRIRYSFVRQLWDLEIAAITALDRLKLEESDPAAARLTDTDRKTLCHIEEAGITTLMAFLDHVSTQEAASAFCKSARIAPENLLELLRKVYKYLPFGAQIRQLVDKDDKKFQTYVDHLMSHKLGFSLALLETGRTRAGREKLAMKTGIPKPALLDLVRRADLTRLRLMGGGMIRASWALGYKGLSALKKASPKQYYTRSEAHYNKTANGRPFDLSAGNVESHLARMKQAIPLIEE